MVQFEQLPMNYDWLRARWLAGALAWLLGILVRTNLDEMASNVSDGVV